MLKHLHKKQIFKCRSSLGIHCLVKPDGTRKFFCVLLTNKRGNLEIERTALFEQLTEQFFTDFSRSTPISFSMDGKGILIKKIAGDASKNTLQQVIPNAVESDFYYETFDASADQQFVAVVRQDLIKGILEQFADEKRFVVDLSVSPLKAAKLTTLFEDIPPALHLGACVLHCESGTGKVQEFARTTQSDMPNYETYRFVGNEIAGEYLVPYVHALTYFLNAEEESPYEAIKLQNDEFAFKRVLGVFGIGVLLLVFLGLLLNLTCYFHFSERKQFLEAQISGNEQLLQHLKKLKDELGWKEKFLSQAGILQNSRLSYYADQIAASIPDEISLEMMALHPLLSKIKQQKEIVLQPQDVVIEGFTMESTALNAWTQDLKKFKWIREASVTNYLQDNTAMYASFTVTIHLK